MLARLGAAVAGATAQSGREEGESEVERVRSGEGAGMRRGKRGGAEEGERGERTQERAARHR